LAWGPLTTIRFRLGAALTAALVPVLLLGAAQAGLAFHKEGDTQRLALALAAERGAATARARIASAQVLIETIGPEAVGYQCVQRLLEVSQRLKGYDNLIRYDALGRVGCATSTATAPGDWFARLRAGEARIVIPAPPGLSHGRPALLAAQAAYEGGRFDGATAAVIDLAALQPDLTGSALPADAHIDLADEAGDRLTPATGAGAWNRPPTGFAEKARREGSMVYYGRDGHGADRVYSAAPLAGEVFIILSAPSQGLFSWARLNPLSSVFFPLLAFIVALAAVWFTVERVVVRWLTYLQRIADIYGRGRFSVRPLQADHAPPEVRELAHALEQMADAVAARDAELIESLTQKDSLMREIHHRVKNNLQVITSLLSMQQRALTDEVARDAMSDTRQRIGALALIYRALYQSPNLKQVDLRQFLGDLLGQLVVERHHDRPALQTELEADPLNIDPDKLAPLALFAVEAVASAQRRAMARPGAGLHIRFTVHGDEAELVIADTGEGDPVTSDADPAAGEAAPGESVSRTLMTAFARQLRGRMEHQPTAGGGLSTRLIFPTPRVDGASETTKPTGTRKRNSSAA
jgi:two-component sensor histidine kinase